LPLLDECYHNCYFDIILKDAGKSPMPAVTIRNLSEATHRALKARAKKHGRSTEAEIRDILEQAAKPAERVKLGTLLSEIGRKAGLTNEDWEAFEAAIARDKTPAEPIRFDDE
jgi:plasmid stability protein